MLASVRATARAGRCTMRKALLGVGLLLILLSVTSVTAESYRVILKNGSWVQAREKPEAGGGNTRIRLSGGGVAVIPGDSIDWGATERWNKTANEEKAKTDVAASRTPVGAPGGTITMVGDPHQGDPQEGDAQPSGDASDAGRQPAGNEPASNSLGQKRQRYQQLEQELGRLRTQKGDLERQAHSSIYLDEARGLRNQAADLETRIQRILAEQKTLLAEGDTATVNTGDDQTLRRRIRFLDTEISKLRQEKAQLERQAHNQVSLDEAKVLRDKANGLFTRIQSLETEREGVRARLSQRQP